MLTIKVLGPGCPNCRTVEEVARRAAGKLGLEATIEKVTAMPEIIRLGVIRTPGLVIDDKVVCFGRIPSEAEVTSWLATAAGP